MSFPHRALLIGCGNIGALYDLNNEQVLTHAKGYFLNPQFSLTVYDTNTDLAKTISEKYDAKLLTSISPYEINRYDCISICTPASTHFSFLDQCFDAGCKVILCEKPVSYSSAELEALMNKYSASSCKVLVNYIRRFQPAYIDLKEKISEIKNKEQLMNIKIRYHRGFINNCGHALDLLEFLLSKKINFTSIQKYNIYYDFSESDPTLSLKALWEDTAIEITGLTGLSQPIFEVELLFANTVISITESGNKITIFRKNSSFLVPLTLVENSLKNYMAPVIQHIHNLLTGKEHEDNFQGAVALNQKMLSIVNN